MLRRGKGERSGRRRATQGIRRRCPPTTPASAEWKLDGDLGRRYAGVSGDRNPIHMHSLTAKPLGFPAAIAHGMWTKARCLAALESRLPDAFAVEVRFRKPILLPARVEFASAREGEEIVFAVRDAKKRHPAPRRPRDAAEPNPSQDREEEVTTTTDTTRAPAWPSAAWASACARSTASPAPTCWTGSASASRSSSALFQGTKNGFRSAHRRRPHLQGGPAAGQTGAPEEEQVEGPVRPQPRRRAADVPGGRPRLRRGQDPPGRAGRRRGLRDAEGAARRRPPSSASTCSASPRSSAASCTSSRR